ncbi:hypothetical protein BGW37DRAFT_521343 [Umbelopsis sp. PMI_123]|nr:hypothetical protein BGW37DRAFT_521343 [Umbelopsis sp. PMI_123]
MVRKGKRKSSTIEVPDPKSESRSSRRKTSQDRSKSNKASSSRSKKGKEKRNEGKCDVQKAMNKSSDSVGQTSNTSADSLPVNSSLGDRIDELLPEELYRDDTSNDSDNSVSDISEGIPPTIERRPLPWANEPDTSDKDSSDNEDDMNWETVTETEVEKLILDTPTKEREIKDVEITFEAPKPKNRKSKLELEVDRIIRELLHNVHVVCLVGHYMMRNKWCSRDDIKDLCKSVIPNHIYTSLDTNGSDIKKCVRAISSWWRSYFKVTSPGIATQAYEEFENLDEEIRSLLFSNLSSMPVEKKAILVSQCGEEFIFNSEDFIKCLVSKQGSRDTSAELFVAILRSIDIDARLVCSLQPISFRVAAERTSESRKKKGVDGGKQRDSSPSAHVDEPKASVKFPFRTPAPRLSPPAEDGTSKKKETNPLTSPTSKPPTVWAEIYDDRLSRWIAVDPIRGFIDEAKAMEPPVSSKSNIISYVLAFDSDCDGCIDVTRRYTSHWVKTNRLRGRELSKSEKEIGRKPWWDDFYETIRRRKLGEREQGEEAEFESLDEKEPIPTSISRFNNHRLYALERHLKKFEILEPNATVLGKIKGENIYPRSAVHPVSTMETWLKQGRSVKQGEKPIKTVNARAVTLEKKRAKEIARQDGEDLQVGCYAYWQTEKFRPQQVIDGVIPKNAFGNVDLYQPDMCPIGATHIPIQGIAKIAKKLGVDFAEAVIGFDFARQRSVPIVNGIVVPTEAKDMILEAWQETQAHESRKALAKQEVEIYSRWKRLITSALLHKRLNEAYGDDVI